MYGNAVYKEGGKSTLRILDCRGEGPTEATVTKPPAARGLAGATGKPAPTDNPPLAGPPPSTAQ